MNPDMLIIVYLNYDNISINQKGAGEVEGLWLSGFVNLLWPMRTQIPHSMNSSREQTGVVIRVTRWRNV